jgi:penicillin-binding protein 1A
MISFKTEKIIKSPSAIKSKTRKRRTVKTKKVFFKILFKILFFLVILTTFSVVIWWFILYEKIIEPLPPVSKLKDFSIPQTSSIYDRKWNLLYSVFKEKRTYIGFEKINKNMINAIVAWEDKRFWTNPWFDLIWLIRAWINWILTWHVEGTSTISQQLIKNTFLTNERSYERKIKEIYLSYQMTNEYTKETIIELYLNKISFGNNSHGVEQASKTYFNKNAKDLNYLEASLLASIPKWPTLFSPYKFKNKKWILVGYPRLVWYPYIYPKHSVEWINNTDKKEILIEKNKINIFPNADNSKYTKEIEEFKKVINNLKIKQLQEDWDRILVCWMNKKTFKNTYNIDSYGCSNINYSDLLNILNNVRIEVWENYIEYQTWRKDFILQRMLEDWYLSKKWEDWVENYKEAIINWVLFDFKKDKTKIKYPHFVFYVKEYLEEKYWKSAMEEWWFKIYTTLDPELQDKSQKIVEVQAEINLSKFGANNAATIVLDNEKWEILAMIGWKDYYNKKIDWENNIITSRLQPGSTFKPFVYALAMRNNKIWPKTPLFDVETIFQGWYTPKNFDGKFMEKMSVEKALNYSRNIPAIKMFFLAWWENSIINFMRKLWVETYFDFKKYYKEKYNKDYDYGSPMALWTWEMTPLELATAYSTIASMWYKKEITPIMKIIDKNWIDLKIREKEQTKIKEAISPETAYLITSVLANSESRPSFWNQYMTIPWRKLAAKTGTSTKQFTNKYWTKEIFPQNLWTIWYTPQYTTVAWAGNTNGKELYFAWNWLEWAWPIMRNVMAVAHEWKKIESWTKPKWIIEVVISTNSWKLPTDLTPVKSKEKSLFINLPTQYDDSYFSREIDVLCNWKVTDNTPIDAIKLVKWIKYNSLRPNYKNWELPVSKLSNFWDDIYTNDICERWKKDSSMDLWINLSNNWNLVSWANYVELAYRSKNPIIKLEILLDWKKLAVYNLPWKLEWWYRWSFNIPSWMSWKKTLLIKAIDSNFYSKSITKNVTLWWKDRNAPIIKVTNPIKWSISLEKNTTFNLRATFSDLSPIRAVNVYFNWKKLNSTLKSRKIVIPISSAGLSEWTYNIKIEATDTNFNTSSKNIKVTILP